MNEIEKENLIILSKFYKNIRLNINEYCDMLKMQMGGYDFQPVTIKEILQLGHYGTLNEAKLWISKWQAPGYISVSNLEIKNTKHEDKEEWLPSVPLKLAHQIDHIFKLKAFL